MAHRWNSWCQPAFDRGRVICLSVLWSAARTAVTGGHWFLPVVFRGCTRHSMRIHAGDQGYVFTEFLDDAVP